MIWLQEPSESSPPVPCSKGPAPPSVTRSSTPPPVGTGEVSVQGTVTSAELDPILTDDPDTVIVGDPTVVILGPAGGGTGPELPAPTVTVFTPVDGTVITEPTTVTATLDEENR